MVALIHDSSVQKLGQIYGLMQDFLQFNSTTIRGASSILRGSVGNPFEIMLMLTYIVDT